MIKTWFIKFNLRRTVGKIIKLSPLISAGMLISVYILALFVSPETYFDISAYLYEVPNANFQTAFWLALACYWHKLCFYNWICVIFIAGTSIFNIACKALLNPNDFQFYIDIYSYTFIPFALLLIITFYIKDTQNIKNETNMDYPIT